MNNAFEFTVKGNRYSIEFPNVGKFRQIESLKQVLSKGMYGSMIATTTVSSMEALDMIDIESYLSVLTPDLLKDLKCENLSELGLEDYLELKKSYQEQFVPWWNEIMKLLNPKKN